MGFKIFAEDADPVVFPPTFVVSAEYGYGKSTYSEKTHVDLRPYMGTSVPHHPVVEELERVRKSIDKLSGAANQAAAALIQANRAEGKE